MDETLLFLNQWAKEAWGRVKIPAAIWDCSKACDLAEPFPGQVVYEIDGRYGYVVRLTALSAPLTPLFAIGFDPEYLVRLTTSSEPVTVMEEHLRWALDAVVIALNAVIPMETRQ